MSQTENLYSVAGDVMVGWQSDEDRDYIEDRMRRITLRWSTPCVRCGQTTPAGDRASWDPETKLVDHGLVVPCG